MGNSNSLSGDLYLNSKEVLDILGTDRYETIKRHLIRITSCRAGAMVSTNRMDFPLFSTMMQMRFERMPRILCECLYRAFAPSLKSSVDITDFLGTLALSNIAGKIINRSASGMEQYLPLVKKMIFRIYDVHSIGEIDRVKTERLLLSAYGETLSPAAMTSGLDLLFSRSYQKTGEIYSPSATPSTSSYRYESRDKVNRVTSLKEKDFENLIEVFWAGQSIASEGTHRLSTPKVPPFTTTQHNTTRLKLRYACFVLIYTSSYNLTEWSESSQNTHGF